MIENFQKVKKKLNCMLECNMLPVPVPLFKLKFNLKLLKNWRLLAWLSSLHLLYIGF